MVVLKEGTILLTDDEIPILQLVLPYLGFTIIAEIRCCVSFLIIVPTANNLMKDCLFFV